MKEFVPLKRTLTLSFLAAELFLGGCSGDPMDIVKPEGNDGSKVIVCTTTMIHDIGKILAGDLHNVRGIMQPGEDPHIYELKPHDTILIIEADLVLMNGLHLEAQVGHVIDKKANGKVVRLAVDSRIKTLGSEDMEGAPDPHCWFNPEYYKVYVEKACNALSELDPKNAETYRTRTDAYLKELDGLQAWGKEAIATIPNERRIMVTSHDAFQYLGQAFDIEVHAVAGISTEQDPTPQDRLKLEALVKKRGAKALFIETSVRDALNVMIQQIAKATDAKVGGVLHSDSLGAPGSGADTYLSMLKYNLNTVVKALQ
jgi:manganese/zinc/iron transport system substrate-binding protein